MLKQLAATILLLTALACTQDAGPRSGAESHFLQLCSELSGCQAPLSCICGVCSSPCEGFEQCMGIDGAQSCQSAANLEGSSCAAGEEPLICSNKSPCGDAVCDPESEDCANCPDDCGECPAACSDGYCGAEDFVFDCPGDGDCNCGDGECLGEGELCFCRDDCGNTVCP